MVEVSAGPLGRGTARPEFGRAFGRRKAGQFEILEGFGRDGRDVPPVGRIRRSDLPGATERLIGGIGMELRGEDVAGERGEVGFRVHEGFGGGVGRRSPDESGDARCECGEIL